jgi:cytochrome c oxidase subunit 2
MEADRGKNMRLALEHTRIVSSLAFILFPYSLSAATSTDPSLVPSIFAPESAPAHSIHHLSLFVLAISAGIFAVVFGLIAYAAIRFRRRADDDGTEPPQVYGSNPLETAWTTVPFLIVVVLALATARVIHGIQDAPMPPSALDVEIVGHQWWWEIHYPKLGIVTANELHVPVSDPQNRAVTSIELRSADVVHSFWVPRLAGKTDLYPNRVNKTWIEPTRTGLFLGQCAAFCGTEHALMLLRVYVHTPEEFERWVKEQQGIAAGDPAVAAGRLVFERTACINCHALNGTVGDGRFGPDLTHLMSRDTLGSGALKNSPENLHAWVKNPSQFKPGVLMPAMNLNATELDELVAYLSTLK